MGYEYANHRSKVFTEDGQTMFLKVRDRAHALIEEAGAVRSDKLISAAGSGDVWDMLACIDRLVELGEIHEVQNTVSRAGQHRIFTAFKPL